MQSFLISFVHLLTRQTKIMPYRKIHMSLVPLIALISSFPKHCKPCLIYSLDFHKKGSHVDACNMTIWHVVKKAHVTATTRCKPRSLKWCLQQESEKSLLSCSSSLDRRGSELLGEESIIILNNHGEETGNYLKYSFSMWAIIISNSDQCNWSKS